MDKKIIIALAVFTLVNVGGGALLPAIDGWTGFQAVGSSNALLLHGLLLRLQGAAIVGAVLLVSRALRNKSAKSTC